MTSGPPADYNVPSQLSGEQPQQFAAEKRELVARCGVLGLRGMMAICRLLDCLAEDIEFRAQQKRLQSLRVFKDLAEIVNSQGDSDGSNIPSIVYDRIVASSDSPTRLLLGEGGRKAAEAAALKITQEEDVLTTAEEAYELELELDHLQGVSNSSILASHHRYQTEPPFSTEVSPAKPFETSFTEVVESTVPNGQAPMSERKRSRATFDAAKVCAATPHCRSSLAPRGSMRLSQREFRPVKMTPRLASCAEKFDARYVGSHANSKGPQTMKGGFGATFYGNSGSRPPLGISLDRVTFGTSSVLPSPQMVTAREGGPMIMDFYRRSVLEQTPVEVRGASAMDNVKSMAEIQQAEGPLGGGQRPSLITEIAPVPEPASKDRVPHPDESEEDLKERASGENSSGQEDDDPMDGEEDDEEENHYQPNLEIETVECPTVHSQVSGSVTVDISCQRKTTGGESVHVALATKPSVGPALKSPDDTSDDEDLEDAHNEERAGRLVHSSDGLNEAEEEGESGSDDSLLDPATSPECPLTAPPVMKKVASANSISSAFSSSDEENRSQGDQEEGVVDSHEGKYNNSVANLLCAAQGSYQTGDDAGPQAELSAVSSGSMGDDDILSSSNSPSSGSDEDLEITEPIEDEPSLVAPRTHEKQFAQSQPLPGSSQGGEMVSLSSGPSSQPSSQTGFKGINTCTPTDLTPVHGGGFGNLLVANGNASTLVKEGYGLAGNNQSEAIVCPSSSSVAGSSGLRIFTPMARLQNKLNVWGKLMESMEKSQLPTQEETIVCAAPQAPSSQEYQTDESQTATRGPRSALPSRIPTPRFSLANHIRFKEPLAQNQNRFDVSVDTENVRPSQDNSGMEEEPLQPPAPNIQRYHRFLRPLLARKPGDSINIERDGSHACATWAQRMDWHKEVARQSGWNPYSVFGCGVRVVSFTDIFQTPDFRRMTRVSRSGKVEGKTSRIQRWETDRDNCGFGTADGMSLPELKYMVKQLGKTEDISEKAYQPVWIRCDEDCCHDVGREQVRLK